MYYNQPICLQTHVLLAPWFTSWTTALRTLMLKDFVWSRCVMFLLWLIFLMVSRKQDNKKRENISNPVAFSIFENSLFLDFVWSHYELESLYCSRMRPCLANFSPASVPYGKSMTPVRDVHSFSPFINFFASMDATSQVPERNIDQLWRVHQQTALTKQRMRGGISDQLQMN